MIAQCDFLICYEARHHLWSKYLVPLVKTSPIIFHMHDQNGELTEEVGYVATSKIIVHPWNMETKGVKSWQYQWSCSRQLAAMFYLNTKRYASGLLVGWPKQVSGCNTASWFKPSSSLNLIDSHSELATICYSRAKRDPSASLVTSPKGVSGCNTVLSFQPSSNMNLIDGHSELAMIYYLNAERCVSAPLVTSPRRVPYSHNLIFYLLSVSLGPYLNSWTACPLTCSQSHPSQKGYEANDANRLVDLYISTSFLTLAQVKTTRCLRNATTSVERVASEYKCPMMGYTQNVARISQAMYKFALACFWAPVTYSRSVQVLQKFWAREARRFKLWRCQWLGGITI